MTNDLEHPEPPHNPEPFVASVLIDRQTRAIIAVGPPDHTYSVSSFIRYDPARISQRVLDKLISLTSSRKDSSNV